MTTPAELLAARVKLEQALQDYVRLTRDDVGNVFVQDYVIAVASESMDEGHSNVTYFNHMNRIAMPIYAVVGLLDNCLGYYREAGNRHV